MCGRDGVRECVSGMRLERVIMCVGWGQREVRRNREGGRDRRRVTCKGRGRVLYAAHTRTPSSPMWELQSSSIEGVVLEGRLGCDAL